MKNLIDLYKSILSSVGMTSDTQGFISTLTPGSDTPKPWTVEGKRGVLPTSEQLKQPDWSNRIGFHPLLQNLTGGESRVLEKFRERMNGNSDFVLGMLLIDVAQLAVKEELHKDLTPEQATYLGPFSDADEKFVKLLMDLTATKRVVKKNFEFVRFSVIKGRQWQGQKRSRVAVAHFPLYEALPKDNKPITLGNFKLRIVDVKMLRSMYEFLFPGIREAGYYEIGSDSKIAPSLETLMALYGVFAESINKAVAILEPVINTSNALLIVDDWRDTMADLTPLLGEIRNIPYLEGNIASERVAAAAVPARISDTPIAKTVVAADVAPTITADMAKAVPQQQPAQQEVQAVQQPAQPQPRFKLGMKPSTVTAENATHQISDEVAKQVSGLSYSRPAPTPLVGVVAPTPPVGSLLPQAPQPQFQQPVMQQAAVPQAMKVPDSARLINGQLYIPVEGSGVSGIPPGAVMADGKVMVPLAAAGVPVGVAVAPAGMAPAPFQQPGRFGMPQQQITDPSQIPGLSAEEVQFYRNNTVMFQHFLQNMQATGIQQAQLQVAQRQQTVPRYLQNAVAQAQQDQMAARGFFRR